MAEDPTLRDLVERARVAEVVNTLFASTDARIWPQVRECFAPVVTFDMSSLSGGTAQPMSPEQIASAWETGLAPIEQLHHQIGNLSIKVKGDEARASCYGTAYHFRRTRSGRNTRTFVGTYDFHFRLHDGAWQIDLFRFNLKFIDGNKDLEKEPA